MADVTPAMIKELRERTGRHALNEAEKLALEAMKRSGVE